MRNAAGVLLPNTNVGVRISLLQGSANGTVVFSETHTPTTNANGLISIFVGAGTPLSGNIATINWGNGTYFLKSELDIAGGSNYTLSQTDQILSVAYALHSASTSSVDWTNVQNKPNFGTSTFSGSYLDLTNRPVIPASFSGSYLDLTNRPVIPASFSGSYLDLTNKPVIINNTFTGSYTDLINKPIIPTSFSGSYLDLTNKPIIVNNTFTGSYTDLTNKPIIPASFSGSYFDLTNKPVIVNNTFTGSYSDLTNKTLIPASFSGSYLDLTNKPVIINNTFTGSYTDLTNKPVIINNTFTGSYSDLTNKPIIPTSFSGSYLDLTNKPSIVTLTGGNAISISGTNQIVNTAPDRIVSILGINVTVTGTYPAFTVTGASANATTFTGGAGISISGTNQIINTAAMPNGTIAGQMLYWNGTKWVTVQPSNSHAEFLRYCNGVPTWGACVPKVSTTAITDIYANNALSGGTIISDAGLPVTSKGICFSTSPNPTLANTVINNGTGTGQFLSNLGNLTTLTTYYVRAYATNAIGTAYGNEISFTNISSSIPNLTVGGQFFGGIIAYILQSADPGYDANVPHGIVAVPTEQRTFLTWNNGSNITTNATGNGIADGTGMSNTNTIVSIQGAGNYAAKYCSDLVYGGYSDWYLPTASEVSKLIYPCFIEGNDTWSSTESTYQWASYNQYGQCVGIIKAFKSEIYAVRAVRSF